MSRGARKRPGRRRMFSPGMEAALLAEWADVGARLIEADPSRFAKLMEIGHEIAEIHRDPFVKFDRAAKQLKPPAYLLSKPEEVN